MSVNLTIRIPIRDQRGNVIDEKEVATYAGLLARAHEEGLKIIATVMVQIPTPENGNTAIVSAVVETSKGKFSGIGDASPENVNRKIVPHIIRMAETRAKARALRDAVNIGVVCLEELGTDTDLAPEPVQQPNDNIRQLPDREQRSERTNTNNAATRSRSAPEPMSEAQRRYLFRLLTADGCDAKDLTHAACSEAGVEKLADITKSKASTLIDQLAKRQDENRRGA